MDERAEKVAQSLVEYSTYLGPEDTVLIFAEDTFNEFAELVGKFAEAKGAKVLFDFENLAKKREVIERNNIEELEKEAKERCALVESVTARIAISAISDNDYLKGIDPKKIADYGRIVRKPLFDRICGDGDKFKGLKWNVVSIPCEAHAKIAGMTLKEYTEFLYNSELTDYNKLRAEMLKIKAMMDNAEKVRVVVPGSTDLTVSLKGRGAALSAGKYNVPDGEILWGPVEDSANGYISFPYPVLRDGIKIKGIKLTFKDGEVVEYSAEENQDYLTAMLNLKGAKRIGEFAFGFNSDSVRVMTTLAFDAKIGGTKHIALGDSYKCPLDDGGGLNESQIHWDIVCDLRKVNGLPGGEVYVDGKLVQKDGQWILE